MDIAVKYNIERKNHPAVRDNGEIMIRATRLANYTSLRCVAYTLQLTAYDAIFPVAEIDRLMKKCRKIVGHFHASEQALSYLDTNRNK